MRNLFTTWYDCGNAERHKELDYCIGRNMKRFNKIFLLTDCGLDNLISKKAQEITKGNLIPIAIDKGKPTYKQLIDAINEHTSPLDINIIANTDIIFDDTINLADDMQPDQCYALSRWEMDSFTEKYMAQIQVYGDSQDVWIFRGKIKEMFSDFPLGTRGCDNRIAYEIQNAGYKITNPSKSIKCWHLHKSNVRDYLPGQGYAVPGPYLNVPVTSL